MNLFPSSEQAFASLDGANVDALLTVREVAARLRVDQTTVRRWILHGTLAAVELPHAGKRRQYRVKNSTLVSIIDTLPSSTT